MHWWQNGIIYQIYPRSFQDTNGDGIGDLAGITRRLDYVAGLGVAGIWISPFFVSPMADFGYDIADYRAIEPIFGTMNDFDRLIDEAHARGLRVILDFVANHTSDQHPWFKEARSSRNSPKRNWYVWADPNPDGSPPNNWISEFGGRAWSFDEETSQYYYHAFLPDQPDLNWRNPAVQEAMLDILKFWLDKGVDGFRVDAIHHLFEDDQLRDNPPNPRYRPEMGPAKSVIRLHTLDQPEVQSAVQAMRRLVNQYDGERVLIGEAYLPISRMMAYYGPNMDGFHLPFNFHLIKANWSAEAIGRLVQEYEAALPGRAWPNWVLGNHDKPRIASRIGEAQARVAAMLLLTLRGTPTLYQGDELAMCDVLIAEDQVHDPFEKRVPGLGLGRDPCRTPMQWSDEIGAGFTLGKPWLPLSEDYPIRNVELQQRDPLSMLALYRSLIALRNATAAFREGAYVPISNEANVLVFDRAFSGETWRVVLNFDDRAKSMSLPRADATTALSTYQDTRSFVVADQFQLRPSEGLLIRLLG